MNWSLDSAGLTTPFRILPTSEPSALETHGMDAQIDDADTDAAAGEQTRWYVRIDQGIKIVR